MTYAELISRVGNKKVCMMACFLGGFLLAPLPAIAASDALTVYAGPQSVAPTETIHVNVGVSMEALASTNVKLSYTQEGVRQIVTGKTQYGLASFKVPAQKRSGQMSFQAEAGGVESEKALVRVTAGNPKPFNLLIKRGVDNNVEVYSNVITDDYNNAVSPLSLVVVDWVDADGLKSSQNAHLSRGAIELKAACPKDYVAPLRIRASLRATSYISHDLSAFCQSGKE